MLIQDGQVLEDAAQASRSSRRDDLLAEIQSAGAATFDDVSTASLLPSGKVIVVQKEANQSTQQNDDLRARLDHLTELVERLSRQTSSGSVFSRTSSSVTPGASSTSLSPLRG